MTNQNNQLVVNALRILSIEGVQAANSGHPGLPLGAAPMAYELWAHQMKHNPKDPQWMDRDRFVLSAGHGSMLIYSLLHLFGYGLEIEDLKRFRQDGSKTPGHPEFGHTVGVETTTGPLGAGLATAVGMAIAETNLAAHFNKENRKVIDHYTYVIAGDGCMMEGITSESSSLAGTLKLGKLIVLYDSNNITIEGGTDIAFTEDVAGRYRAYGWQVLTVSDGNDLQAIGAAIDQGKANLDQPTLVIVKTQIGYGCPARQGKASAHGEPLGADNIKATKDFLGWPNEEAFQVPADVYAHMEAIVQEKQAAYDQWTTLYNDYKTEYPVEEAELKKWLSGDVNLEQLDSDEFFEFENKPNATRNISGEVIQRLVKFIPNLLGGSADLAPSTKTYMNGKGDYSAIDRAGMNMHYGVRELAMTAIGNGIAVHGGFKSFVSTFFVFSDYMKPMIRLAALMNLPLIGVLTHDSIGVGEDGPTHQPIEQLASLRSIPNVVVFRPADAKEVAAAWHYGVTSKARPTMIALTRQNVPYYEKSGKGALKGAYVILDSHKEKPDIILIASGSEVEYAYEAALKLRDEKIDARVVSMPSMELFEEQTDAYKESILPKSIRKRVAIEAGATFGWHKYVGLDGCVIGIDRFGQSAPGDTVYKALGITTEAVYASAKRVLG